MFQRLALILMLWNPAMVQAGSVRLLNGEYHEGKVELSLDGVNVAVAGNSVVPVGAAKIFSAVFKGAIGPNVVPGVVLTNGTILSGLVRSMDGPAITLGSPPVNVPIESVAWIIFAPAPREKLLAPASTNHSGALLANGDFFPGTIAGIKDNRIEVNSLLFGPHKLVLGQQAVAVQLRPVAAAGARYWIVARNGDEFQTDNPGIDHPGISLRDPVAGDIKIKAEDVIEVHAGASFYQSLASLQPRSVIPPAGTSIEDAFKVPGAQAQTPVAASSIIVSSVNTQVAYAVPTGFEVFACTVGVPRDAPPETRLVFGVYGDGRLIARSPPRGTADEPAVLDANLAGVRVLTLRVESAVPLNGPVMGLWIEPILTRR